MASCVRNIRTKNYKHLIIGFQVTVKNVGDVFETQFRLAYTWNRIDAFGLDQFVYMRAINTLMFCQCASFFEAQ